MHRKRQPLIYHQTDLLLQGCIRPGWKINRSKPLQQISNHCLLKNLESGFMVGGPEYVASVIGTVIVKKSVNRFSDANYK
jgi:hypothetical protein